MVEMNSFERDFKRDPEFGTEAPEAPPQQPQPQGQQFPPQAGSGQPGYQNGRPPPRQPDLLDSLWNSVNHDLLMAKTFYFFFFSAFGSLFPLMGIFFKQLGMNPIQCGLLIGFRPFVEFMSAPFWGTIADRYQKGKQILLASLVCWVAFTLALCFVSPPAASCIVKHNATHFKLVDPDQQMDDYEKRSMRSMPWMDPAADQRDMLAENYSTYQEGDGEAPEDPFDAGGPRREKRGRHKFPPGHVIGQSPYPVRFAANYDEQVHGGYVSPIFSTLVYERAAVQSTFYLILLLVVIGEFFSSPAITLADSVTLTYLGENANNYGKQRMFGSFGWGLAMFFVGIALDHSTMFAYHPCGPHERERNYTICFAVFSVLMGCAFIAATQLRFDYDALDDTIAMKPMPEGSGATQQQQPKYDGDAAEEEREPKPEKSTVFASKIRQVPEWLRVLKTFANLRYGAFLFVAWFMGFGVGLVFTFLFWHLQDLGGTPTLFGVASVINHISEIFAYFFSFRLIRQVGHVRVLCIGLLGNLARFLYVSWLWNPWWVLPFEFIQGVTHAAVWAACCSYITQATPMNLRSSAQGVLQGLHHGLGRGCGAVLGGLLSTYFGTAVTFRTYGFICLFVLVAFVFINYYQPEHGFSSAESVEPHQVLEESSHLAPHGVPSGHMPRALSSSRLEDLDNNGSGQGFTGYGTADKKNDPFLDIPRQGGGNGGGGGWGLVGEASSDPAWPTDADFTNALLTRKHFQLGSPLPKFDYDYIQENFKAYNEVLNMQGGGSQRKESFDGTEDENNGNQLLNAPPPKTVLHSMQPTNRQYPSSYEW